MQTAGAAVACRTLTKDFGSGDAKVAVLRGLNLEVPYGAITLLAGPSGCGKTTLLSVIAGLLTKTGGELSVLGSDADSLRGAEAVRFRRKNLGFIFQQYNLLPALTAAENAAVPLLAAGMKRKPAVEKAEALLEEMGLGSRARAFPRQLSGGQQQRVAIARALIHDPRLLVCDEPTAALDAETGHVVMEILRRKALRSDRAVLIVTHDSRVFRFGDRIAHMNDGRIIHTEIQESGSIPELIGGEK
jgi:putative ABC transport system ATP-binding protein